MVLPEVLVLNVLEISSGKVSMRVEERMECGVLNRKSGETWEYELLGIVHTSSSISQEGHDPLYFLTMKVGGEWIQILYDQFEKVLEIEQLLNLKQDQSDIELLVYRKC